MSGNKRMWTVRMLGAVLAAVMITLTVSGCVVWDISTGTVVTLP